MTRAAFQLAFAVLAAASVFSCQKSEPATPAGSGSRAPAEEKGEEEIWLEALDKTTTSLVNDYGNDELDSREVFATLDSLEKAAIEKFTENSKPAALVWHRRGVAHSRKERYAQAIECYQAALKIREAILPPGDPVIARSYTNIGGCHQELGNNTEAIRFLTKSINLQLAGEPGSLLATTYLNLSRSYGRLQDTDNQRKYLESAIEELENYKDWNHLGVACNDMALLLTNELGEHQAALAATEKAMWACTDAGNRSDIQEADIQNTKGLARMELGEFDRALEHNRRSLSINRKLLPLDSGRAQFVGLNLNNAGLIYKRQGLLRQAADTLREALEHFDPAGHRSDIAGIHDNLGDIAALENNLAEALDEYNLAASFLADGFHPGDALDNPGLTRSDEGGIELDLVSDKSRLFTVLASKARTLHRLFEKTGEVDRLRAALNTCLVADALADLMRQDFRPDASKVTLAEKTSPVYEQAIRTCVILEKLTGERRHLETAFGFAEKSRAVVLLEAVRGAKALEEIPDSLLAEERQANLEKSEFETQYAEAEMEDPASPQAASLRASLLNARLLHDAALLKLEEANPSLKDFKNDTRTASIQALRDSVLEADETLLEYFTGDSATYVFAVRRDTFQVVELSGGFPLESLVVQLREGIGSQKVEEYLRPASELYNRLVEPVARECKLTEGLVIVPGGILGSVPFEALLTKLPDSADWIYFKDHPYLLEKHRVSYNFSATMLQEMKAVEKGRQAKSLFGGYALSFQEKHPEELVPPLKHSVPEVEAIRQLVGGDVFLEKNAAHFLTRAERYKILHLSTHGEAGSSAGDLSCLLFAFNPADGKHDRVYAQALYPLRLRTDLVVLSACETAMGELSRGEGYISLARAFACAGARSLLTTLWLLDDAASKDLMTSFYQLLKDGKNKDEALRKAKLDFIRNKKLNNAAHPYYWSAFIPIGDMRAVEAGASGNLGWAWALAGLGAAALFLFYFFRKKSAAR